jgi:O-antigen ligase
MKNALVVGPGRSSIAYKQRDLGFIPAVVMALSVLLLLRIPADYRDFLFLAGTVVCFAFAFHNFAGVWRFFLLVLPFVHLIGSMFGMPQINLVRILLIEMGLVVYIKARRGFWQDMFKEFGIICLIMFVLANLISAVFHASIDGAFRSLTYIEPVLFYVGAYYIVRQDSANFRRVLWSLVLGGIVVSVLGLIEMWQHQAILDLLGINVTGLHEDFASYLQLDRFGFGGRIVSTIGQPVYASFYFVIINVVMVFYVLQYLPRYKVLLLIIIPLGAVLVIATGTRAAIISVILMFVALIPLSARRGLGMGKIALGGVLAVGLTYALVPNVFNYLLDSFSLDTPNEINANLIGRIDLTRSLLDIFPENPFFGVGPGLIQRAAQQGILEFVGLGGLENQYASILAEGGILAGSWYVLFMFASLRSLLRIRSSHNPHTMLAGLMTLLVFIFYFVATMSASSFVLIPNFLMMTLYGATVALADVENNKQAIAYG